MLNFTPLTKAARYGDVGKVVSLLAAGANPDELDGGGHGALHRAALNGHAAVVRALCAHGARVDLRDRGGRTPLFVAAMYWEPEVLSALLAEGADPEATGTDVFGEPLTAVQYLRKYDGETGRAEELEALIAANGGKKGATPEALAPTASPSASASAGAEGPPISSGAARHLAGVVPALTYVPIRDYVKTVKPSGTAKHVFETEVVPALPGLNGWGEWLSTEAVKVATSVMNNGDNGPLDPPLVYTVVLYTLDVRPEGGKLEENFYNIFNSALQKRDAEVLKKIEGYLYFFMRALELLPAETERVYFRGIPKSAFAVKDKYTNGRRIHWSGISSVSEDEGVGRDFALQEGKIIKDDGPGGILFRITARSGRKISHLSPMPEEEVLLPPNFCGMVTRQLYRDGDVWGIDIMEVDDSGTYVF